MATIRRHRLNIIARSSETCSSSTWHQGPEEQAERRSARPKYLQNG
jgi:hypothetical protein